MPGLFTCYLGRLADHYSTNCVVFVVKYYSFKNLYIFLENSYVSCPSNTGI